MPAEPVLQLIEKTRPDFLVHIENYKSQVVAQFLEKDMVFQWLSNPHSKEEINLLLHTLVQSEKPGGNLSPEFLQTRKSMPLTADDLYYLEKIRQAWWDRSLKNPKILGIAGESLGALSYFVELLAKTTKLGRLATLLLRGSAGVVKAASLIFKPNSF